MSLQEGKSLHSARHPVYHTVALSTPISVPCSQANIILSQTMTAQMSKEKGMLPLLWLIREVCWGMLRLVRVRYLLEHMEVQKVLQHFARQLGEKLVMVMSSPVCCHNVAYLNETDARPGISILVCANNRLSWISCLACPMVIMLHPFWGVCMGDY